MNINPKYSQAQVDRMDAGWSEEECDRIDAQYPELSENDRMDAVENMENSVGQDVDIDPNFPMSVMELYAASCEGISDENY